MDDSVIYLLDNPTQIKSATDNIGTFDGSNPDIRHSKRSSNERKSVNEFTSEEIQKTEKWARKFYRELGTKSPFFRAWFGDQRAQDTGIVNIIHNSDVPCNSDGKVKNVDTDKLVSWSSAMRGETRIHAVKDKVAIQAVDRIEAIT